jgi:hypothetical protein
MMSRLIRVVGIALLGVIFFGSRVSKADVITYYVTGWIDTTDYLIIRGSTLQWEHNISGSPAGTHLGDHPTVISSAFDGTADMSGVSWDQVWPSPLPADAFSSIFTGLIPALPAVDGLTASVVTISGRGTPSIFQQPTAADDYTLIVQYTDGFNGAAALDAEITVVPEPGEIGLVAGLMGFVGICRRRGARCC